MVIRKIFKNRVMRGAYLAWFSIALFYFYQYILRFLPGLMIDNLRSEFVITAEQFATLGTLYLLAYSILQIPLGILVDKFGVKRIVLSSILLCIVGSLMFAISHNFLIAQISRVLIGAGSASAFMCSLKIIADHFPPGQRGFLMGVTLTIGTVGALLSGHTIVFLMHYYGWRSVLYLSIILGIIIFLLAAFLIKFDAGKSNKFHNEDPPLTNITNTVINILKNRNIMLYAILAIGLYTPLSVLADLWGTAFLKQKFNLTQEDAAHISLMMYLGLSIGSLLLPWLCEKYQILNLAIFVCGLAILGIFCILLYGPNFDSHTLSALLILLGFFCGAEMMCFTGALWFSNKNNSGEIIGVVNTLNMMGGAFLQQIIGYSLDRQWDNTYTSSGLRHYNTDQFIYALSVLTLVIMFCCFIAVFLKKIKPKKVY